MAYTGNTNEIDVNTLPAGTYYEIEDTGELYDDERDLEEYGIYWQANPELYPDDDNFYYNSKEIRDADYDEDEDGEWFQEEFTVTQHEIEPYYISRQLPTYREFTYAVNINRKFEEIPADLFGNVEEAETKEAAEKEARKIAEQLSKDKANFVVVITTDTADWGGDEIAYYLNGKEINESAAYDALEEEPEDTRSFRSAPTKKYQMTINRGNWSGGETTLTIRNKTEASTDDFDMSIEYIDNFERIDHWIGTVDWDGDKYKFNIFRDEPYYVAYNDSRSINRENKNIFAALAQLAYAVI